MNLANLTSAVQDRDGKFSYGLFLNEATPLFVVWLCKNRRKEKTYN